MLTWSFYRTDDGTFLEQTYSAKDDHDLVSNTPSGCRAVVGRHRPPERVDLQSGEIFLDTVLDAEIRTRRESVQRTAAARGEIRALEESQARPLRELHLDPSNAEARRKLEAIDAKIAAIRGRIG